MEEILRGCIFGTRLRLFLIYHKPRVGVHLRLYPAAVEECAQFVKEDVIRTAVADEVMDVGIEVQSLLRANDCEAAKAVVTEVERTYELRSEGLKLRLIYLYTIHFYLSAIVYHLLHACVVSAEMNKEFGMVSRNLLNSRTQLLIGYLQRQTCAHRDIIQRGRRVLHALEIDTRLSETQRNTGRFRHRVLGCGCFRILIAIQHLLQYLVLDGLQVSTFDELLGIQLHSEPLIDLRGKFDGGDGTEPHVTQVGSDAEIAVAYDTGDKFFELLL